MKKNLQKIQLQIIPLLKKADVNRSFVFGSYARDEANAQSDLDLIVEFSQNNKSLFDLIRLKHRLEDELGITVDVVTPAAIHPYLKPYIDRDKIQVL